MELVSYLIVNICLEINLKMFNFQRRSYQRSEMSWMVMSLHQNTIKSFQNWEFFSEAYMYVLYRFETFESIVMGESLNCIEKLVLDFFHFISMLLLSCHVDLILFLKNSNLLLIFCYSGLLRRFEISLQTDL